MNYKLQNIKKSAPSCSVKDIFFLHVLERKMLHTRGATTDTIVNWDFYIGIDVLSRPALKKIFFYKIVNNNYI